MLTRKLHYKTKHTYPNKESKHTNGEKILRQN